jgi:hypothetical protein
MDSLRYGMRKAQMFPKREVPVRLADENLAEVAG